MLPHEEALAWLHVLGETQLSRFSGKMLGKLP